VLLCSIENVQIMSIRSISEVCVNEEVNVVRLVYTETGLSVHAVIVYWYGVPKAAGLIYHSSSSNSLTNP
jgi:hypothetical protein